MATQFEHLGKDTPQGSIEALQVGERVRETHELGAHFESLADKAPNVVGNKDNEIEARGGVRDVGKFEMKGNKDRQELEKRTREVIGREEKKKKEEKVEDK